MQSVEPPGQGQAEKFPIRPSRWPTPREFVDEIPFQEAKMFGARLAGSVAGPVMVSLERSQTSAAPSIIEGTTMEHYEGIDVSLEGTSVCVVDATGRIVDSAEVVHIPVKAAGISDYCRRHRKSCPHATYLWRSYHGTELARAYRPL